MKKYRYVFRILSVSGEWVRTECDSWQRIVRLNKKEIVDKDYNKHDIRIFSDGRGIYIYKRVKK
jgi:hypothetical protein